MLHYRSHGRFVTGSAHEALGVGLETCMKILLRLRKIAAFAFPVLMAGALWPLAQEPLAAQAPSESGKASDWVLLSAQQIPWAPGFASLPKGAKIAILEGDPAKDGFFTMRILMPDGYRVPPHSHPRQERLTLISGALMLGMGKQFDERQMKLLTPGSYSSMPPGMAHFAQARGETVLQLSSIGPWSITYINPADDPRNSAK